VWSSSFVKRPNAVLIALSRNLAKSAGIIARFWCHFAMDKWETPPRRGTTNDAPSKIFIADISAPSSVCAAHLAGTPHSALPTSSPASLLPTREGPRAAAEPLSPQQLTSLEPADLPTQKIKKGKRPTPTLDLGRWTLNHSRTLPPTASSCSYSPKSRTHPSPSQLK